MGKMSELEMMVKELRGCGEKLIHMAEEMTEFTQRNVLEQASISVLSQANDLPQQVLSLLQ